MDKRFVVVSGIPGSGKTTLARDLAPLLGLPVIDKDDILERLFEAKGVGDAEWRRRLSRESDSILQAAAVESALSTGAVLTSFWRLPGMPPDSGTPTEWLFDLSDLIVNVRCVCPAEVAAERFARRTRHPGHLDALRTDAEILASIRTLPPITCLTLGEAIDVDTARPLAPDAVAREIISAFTGCLTSACSRRRPGGP
jgi:glucokinase